MIVCINCFSDIELKAYIQALNLKDDCQCCHTQNTYIIKLVELKDFFQELVECFRIDDSGSAINKIIQADWSFFSSHDSAIKILNYILPQLNSTVGRATDIVRYSQEIVDNFQYWNILKNEIKWSNRYIVNTNYLIDELGWDGFFNTQFELNSSTPLYRARIHHDDDLVSYANEKMGCPPREKATAGRANPAGIPFLYLSDNSTTVLYEVRAAYLDELSVAQFKLGESTKSVRIVDFTEDTSLFQPTSVVKTIKAKLLRDRISIDLSKPMRRYDTDLDYIPTQFICEFIKVITGAKGIKFSSSLHPQGNNIVIFDESIMNCTLVKKMRIIQMDLNAIEVVLDK